MTVELPRSVLAYYARVGAEVLNFRRAIVKQYYGTYYKERALIKISNDGTVSCNSPEHAPTTEEVELMRAELAGLDFPKTIRASNIDDLKPLLQGPYYEFIDQNTGEIIMVQERRDNPDPSKAKNYIPWSFLSNGEWACMEPDDGLPFWKPKNSLGPEAKIIVHEGAKAAAYITHLIETNGKHPWLDYLKDFEHWGMIGGALAPHRTNYDELRRRNPVETIYACDRDLPGEGALQKVSKLWGRSLKGMVFGDQFPEKWDMADPIPDNLIVNGRYQGPHPSAMLQPATWATELVPNPENKGKLIVLKSEFEREWFHCISPEVYIHRDWPNIIYTSDEFDNKVAPFSHSKNTSAHVKCTFANKADALKYDPSLKPGLYSTKIQKRIVNSFVPPLIKREKGDETPWLDFLQYLVPTEADRRHLMRWIATLIAHPEIRMLYGVLLISEEQGVGKGTLGEKILKPLVGADNVSFPSEKTIVDNNYNYWLSHKRLAICHEIYSGESSKAYNALKTVITDRDIEVKMKYIAEYKIDNWIHILAMSNSKRALKIADDDRRWLIPHLTEEPRPKEYWDYFNAWLEFQGGLEIIYNWAHEFTDIVTTGEIAPATASKREMVQEAYSPGQKIVERTLSQIKEHIETGRLPDTTFVLDTDLVRLIKDELYDGRHNDHLERPMTVRKVAKALGWHLGSVQAQVASWGTHTRGAKIIAFKKEIAEKTPGQLGGSDLPEHERLRPLEVRSSM